MTSSETSPTGSPDHQPEQPAKPAADVSPPQQQAPGGAHADAAGNGHARTGLWALTLGSMGVVYGDIGTSPLYAFREALLAASGAHNVPGASIGPVPRESVLGVLSLIFWSLVLVVTVKYVIILLRADNNGEGGTLSLMALAQRVLGRGNGWLVGLGIVGAAMFYGDSVITPAITVLSAVEGLKLVTPAFTDYVIPVTAVILIVLFSVQSRGTAKVAAFFGPVMAACSACSRWAASSTSRTIPASCWR